jgi:hypothetical protein
MVSCVYCGAEAGVTRDHVPPKALIPEPRPSSLITVPACRGCNSAFGKDDEYFRQVLVVRADLADRPAVQPLLAKTLRSWRRPRSQGLGRSLARTLRLVNLRSPAGLHVGTAGAYTVDVERLERVLVRVVRGLAYHEFGQALPQRTLIRAGVASESHPDVVRSAIDLTAGSSIKTVVPAVFAYKWNRVGDDHQTSVWIFEFFDVVSCVGLTLNPDYEPGSSGPAA